MARPKIIIQSNFPEEMKADYEAISKAMRDAIDGAVLDAQQMLRAQVSGAGLGAGLAKAWRTETYPRNRKSTLHPGGLVFSRATFLHEAFNSDRVINARKTKYLVIALEAAVAMGFGVTKVSRDGDRVPAGQTRKASQMELAFQKLGKKNFKFVTLSGGRMLVLYNSPKRRDRRMTKGTGVGGFRVLRGQSVPMFLLLKTSRVGRKLDIDSVANRAMDLYHARVVANLKGD